MFQVPTQLAFATQVTTALEVPTHQSKTLLSLVSGLLRVQELMKFATSENTTLTLPRMDA